MEKKKVFFCIFFFILLCLSLINVNAIGNPDIQKEKRESDSNILPIVPPIVLVRGGLGISILIYGTDDETTIGAVVEDAIRLRSKESHILRNIVIIQLSIINIVPGPFIVHVFVGNDVWSFECESRFFVFVNDIKPV